MRLTKFTHLVFYIFSFSIFTSLFTLNAKGQTSLPKGTVSGIVWVDANENSTRDSAEVGFAGVRIEFYNGLTLVAKDTSDTNGFYSFGNLGDGSYRIRVVMASLPKKFAIIPSANYFNLKNVDFDESKDSDVEPTTGVSESKSITQFNISQFIDVGIYSNFAVIEGQVWNDLNKNGTREEGDFGESNVRVYLKDWFSKVYIDSTITDARGGYKFDSIVDGTYFINVSIPFRKNILDYRDFSLQGSTSSIEFKKENFGTLGYVLNTILISDSLGCIEGKVWNDLNRNGIWELGEQPIKDINVSIINTAQNWADHTKTNDQGRYYFNNLIDDSYKVTVSPKTDYMFTNQDVFSDSTDSDFDPLSFSSDIITIENHLSEGQNKCFSRDAGLFKPTQLGSIEGRIWNDLNKNGFYEPSEPPQADLDIYLMNQLNHAVSTTSVDVNGQYVFNNLATGFYKVMFLIPRAYDLAVESDGSPSSNSNFEYGDIFDRISAYSVQSYFVDSSQPIGDLGRNIKHVDTGLFPNAERASIEGYTWEDINENGIRDTNEVAVRGKKVQILNNEETQVLFETYTDSSGYYSFNNISRGYYIINFIHSKLYEGNYTDSSSASSVILVNEINNVLEDENVNFGLKRKRGRISGKIWKDKSGIGFNDTNFSISDLSIYLFDTFSQKLDSTKSDNSGNYSFENLESGKYYLQFETPEGYIPTHQFIGNYLDNSDIDSSGKTFFFEIDNLMRYNDLERDYSYIDAGFVVSGQIGFYTWEDKNNNGIQDDTEFPLANINVTLSNEDGYVNDVVTDSTGKYTFNYLEPGTYRLGFDNNPNYKPTLQYAGTDSTKDSDLDSLTYLIDPIILTAIGVGNKNLSIGAGFQKLNLKGTIGDLVWKDINNNGIQENTELGAFNVIIELYKDGIYFSSDTTDTNGLFSFDNLDSASYKLRVKFTSIPTDLKISTLKNQGQDNSLDSDIDSITFESDEILMDLNDISLLNRTDIDVALVSSIVANCDNTLCVPISIQIRR